jgi:hypothetical protein
MLAWVSQYDGAAIGEPDTPCPECGLEVFKGELITPLNGSYLWRHADCTAPLEQPPRWYYSRAMEMQRIYLRRMYE